MSTSRPARRPYLIIGLLLLVVAAVTAWDASSMRITANYGVGADAASYLVALMLCGLALGHFVAAFWGSGMLVDEVDYKAVGWIGLALASLVAAIGLGGGFILGTTLLFAFTARAFGRRAFLADVIIGAVLGLIVYLLFHGLLTLALPEGPLERLI
jgi:putative tricarboxylic transport membrane protein